MGGRRVREEGAARARMRLCVKESAARVPFGEEATWKLCGTKVLDSLTLKWRESCGLRPRMPRVTPRSGIMAFLLDLVYRCTLHTLRATITSSAYQMRERIQ